MCMHAKTCTMAYGMKNTDYPQRQSWANTEVKELTCDQKGTSSNHMWDVTQLNVLSNNIFSALDGNQCRFGHFP